MVGVSSVGLVHALQETIEWRINISCLKIHLSFGRHENAIEVNSSKELINVLYGKKYVFSHKKNFICCVLVLSQNKVAY